MTSAWKALETLTAWSDDMRLLFSPERRRFVSVFTFLNAGEFHLWQDYNRNSALSYTFTVDMMGRVTVTVDVVKFMEDRFRYGMRATKKNSESEV